MSTLSRNTLINRLRRKIRVAALASGFTPSMVREILLANHGLYCSGYQNRASVMRDLLDRMIGAALVDEIIKAEVTLSEIRTL